MKNFLVTSFILLLMFLIVISPERFISSSFLGLQAFALNVLPCTLPFMILTKIIIEQGNLQKVSSCFERPFKKIFGTSSQASYVFVMSILSGYPVGAKMTADLYENGKITKTEAYRMTSFCSNSGPMFIIGTVGSLLLNNVKFGFILFISHIISALINGVLFSRIKAKNDFTANNNTDILKKQLLTFGEIISNSTQASLNVGAIICLFFIIIEAVSPMFSLLPQQLVPLFEGCIEITRGCIDCAILQPKMACIFCSFIISFGGISTLIQSAVMLKKLKIPMWLFSVQKLSQGIISALITTIILMI